MTPRRRRMMLVGLIVLGVGAAVAFALTAFQENLLYFYTPSDISAGKVPTDKSFRLGGMVPEGSFVRPPGSLEATFTIADLTDKVTVKYSGVLPDLFREGQGVVARRLRTPRPARRPPTRRRRPRAPAGGVRPSRSGDGSGRA